MELCPLSFLGRLKPFFSFWQRKKRMGSKKRFFGRGGNRKKRADRAVRPYRVQRKPEEAGGQSRPTLQGAEETGRSGRTEPSDPTGYRGNRKKRADRVVRPYRVQRKPEEAGGQGRPTLQEKSALLARRNLKADGEKPDARGDYGSWEAPFRGYARWWRSGGQYRRENHPDRQARHTGQALRI